MDAPGRPGIFGVDVMPNRAGRYRLEVVLDAPGLTDRHDLGDVTVLAAADATALVMLAMTEEPADASIPFLKEQQWALDFATARAERRQMGESLVLAAEIEPRTGGRVDVTTPVAGRLAGDLPQWPVGSPVARGDTLAEIIPHSGHGEDRPALELDVAEARDALELARAARARVERLVAVGALPTRRQLEARLAEQTAQARVTASEAHLAQLDATRSGEGEGARDIRFILRAPISGVRGRVGRNARRERRGGRAALPTRRPRSGVHRRLAAGKRRCHGWTSWSAPSWRCRAFAAPVALDRLVAVGRVLDTDSRTVPIIYELSDPDRRLAIGQAVSLRVFVSAAIEAITVPQSAIVDDAGQPVVFVQVAGESFERRAVELGNRELGLVQITGDVAPGERVVVRGAPLIRLAALSPQVPAHGHTH